jgi:pyruvate dehydrogenase E1 component alpha subunit
MLDRSVNFNGSTPILGSIPSLAVGQSYASKFNGKNNVTVVFLGDGSAEEGIFMESVNLAANKKCQIIFVLEDNRYSVASSHADRKSKRYSFKKLYEGLGANYINSSGQDVWKVFKSAQKARSIASKSIPVVLHLNVLRRHGHSGPMKESSNLDYRIGDSIDYRDKNDPINILYARMKKNGYSSKQLENLTKKLSNKYTRKLNSIKKTINVRR